MFKPADTLILDEVEARLANIITANEYNYTMRTIKRGKTTPFKGFDLPACSLYHGSIKSVKTPYGNEVKTMALIVEVHSKTHDDSFIDVADALAADVVVALYRATSAPTVTDPVSIALGGLVQKIQYTGNDPFTGQGEEPFCGTLVKFEVVYETAVGDMENIV